MHSFNPFECARCLDNKVILPIINENVCFSSQHLFHQRYLWLHEIFKKVFIHIAWLASEFDASMETKQWDNFRGFKICINQNWRISVISGNVVNIDSSRTLDDVVKYFSKGVVHIIPKPGPILESCIHYELLYFRSLLIVNQAKIESELSHFSQNIEGMGKSVTDCYSFKPS